MAKHHSKKTKHTSNKHSSSKHTKKSTVSMSSDGKTIKSYCVGCRGNVEVHNVHDVTYKQHGKTRTRTEGVCEHGHKYFRFKKSQ